MCTCSKQEKWDADWDMNNSFGDSSFLHVPETVNFDSSPMPCGFLHSTVVSFLANILEAFTCRVDVKFVLRPLPAMLVRVAVKGGLNKDNGAVKPVTKTTGL